MIDLFESIFWRRAFELLPVIFFVLVAVMYASDGQWLQVVLISGFGALMIAAAIWVAPAVTAVGCDRDGETVTFHLMFRMLTIGLDQVEATSAREASIGLMGRGAWLLHYLPTMLYVKIRGHRKPIMIQMNRIDNSDWLHLKRNGEFMPLDKMLSERKHVRWLLAGLILLYWFAAMYLLDRAGIPTGHRY